jgi:hypothetical protein
MSTMPEIHARLLTLADDWTAKLSGTELDGLGLTAANAKVVVVEQGDQVMGCWATFMAAHVEGLWLAPDAGAGVARSLLSSMTEVLKDAGVTEVLTQSLTPEVDQLIRTAGGRKLPGSAWVIPLTGKEA